MTSIDLIATTSDNTVISEYTPLKRRSEAYQSEADLEKAFIQRLCEQGYEYLPLSKETEMETNLEVEKPHFSNEERGQELQL